MPLILADSWYFIAVNDRADNHHRRALSAARRFPGVRVLTHTAVLTEVLAYFADEGVRARVQAARAVRDVFTTMRVVNVDTPLFQRAVDRYEERPDKQFSLTDCISMVLMEDLGITHVLTNDHHFVQAGFTLVNE
jgi:predicted nucleic acid-binding protein